MVTATDDDGIAWVARFPGASGNGRIVVREAEAPATKRSMDRAPAGTMVRVVISATPTLFVKSGNDWGQASGDAADNLDLTGVADDAVPGDSASFVSANVAARDADGSELQYEDLGLDRAHPRWIGQVLAENPARQADALENTFALQVGANVTPFGMHAGLFPSGSETTFDLTGGSDGGEPDGADYARALAEFAKLENISIVAAPGYSANSNRNAIQNNLIIHAESPRSYRIAVLEIQSGQTPAGARTARSRLDSKYGAIYYPWVRFPNPLARPGVEIIPREIDVPPTGFVCGIYARNDVERGVHKAPANEVVRGALRFEIDVTRGEQEVLNPIGVNCLRYFPGRGYRVWGARTVSSDPEWKYVNVRRYFNYLEHSIDRGTQWVVFEPNGDRLWANVRETVASFLYNEWRTGALLGRTEEEAYFVRCDRSTMTQNDIDNGRLICLIGVAVLKPAEFVIFRIGQKTADARS